MTPKLLHTFGVKRSGAYVTVAQDEDGIVVRWREGGRRSKQYPAGSAGKRHAKAWAQGTHERLSRKATALPPRITLGELFDRYVTAKKPKWRPKSLLNERNRWRYFVETVGPHTPADLVTPEGLDELCGFWLEKGGSRGQPIAPNQVRGILGNVTRVFRWAKKRKLLAENPLADYDTPLGKDAKALDVAEYPPEETARVMAVFSPKDSRRWRAWVALTIAANQGARVNAILQLAVADADTGTRRIRWQAASDKLGRERVQPMTRDTVHAVRVARVWRARMGYTGRFLIPAVRGTRRAADLPWGYAGLHRLLGEAEREAGVPHRRHRAVHGFRRMAGRNALTASGGNLNLAAEWIGDTDLRTFKRSYLKERGEELEGIASMLRTPTEGAPDTTPVRHSPKTREA